MRQWLIFKIGYVFQIPQEGGGRAYLANSLRHLADKFKMSKFSKAITPEKSMEVIQNLIR